MAITCRPPKDIRKKVLREAEQRATGPDVEQSDDLSRIGVVWAGILDLDDGIPATTVAAMLASCKLVQATSSYDAEDHWVEAAAYAALGAYSEMGLDVEEESEEGVQVTSGRTIGFTGD